MLLETVCCSVTRWMSLSTRGLVKIRRKLDSPACSERNWAGEDIQFSIHAAGPCEQFQMFNGYWASYYLHSIQMGSLPMLMAASTSRTKPDTTWISGEERH